MGLDLTELSRGMSHALRHDPWFYELGGRRGTATF